MNLKDVFIHAAMSYLHTPYRWGGDDPSGIDCSGLAQELLSIVGLDLPGDQNADALYRHFKSKDKGIDGAVQTGALVFFGSTALVTHVGMIVDGTIMIEAGGGGSRTKSEADAWAQNAWVRMRPYNRRKDLVAVILPIGLPF